MSKRGKSSKAKESLKFVFYWMQEVVQVINCGFNWDINAVILGIKASSSSFDHVRLFLFLGD